jgi:hypothetical protein
MKESDNSVGEHNVLQSDSDINIVTHFHYHAVEVNCQPGIGKYK